MRNRRLIDLQTELLRRLTSEAFIFGANEPNTQLPDSDLRDMDLGRLRLEAEMSFTKRANRIRQTFARTAELFGSRFGTVLRDFACSCPPRTYERYPDAKDFHDYLVERWSKEPPPWAVDVAKLELTLAWARTLRPADSEKSAFEACPVSPPGLWYIAHPCVAPVLCRYDVSSLFVSGKAGAKIENRDVPLVVCASVKRRRPEIVEIVPEAFRLLERSTNWSILAEDIGEDRKNSGALVMNLAEQGFMLVRTFEASHD